MKLLKRIIIAMLSVLSISTTFAQDPVFSQFFANHLYLNPAFAGSVRCPRVTLGYRKQYPLIYTNNRSISTPYNTTSLSYDQQVDALDGGLGFNIWHDDAGAGTLNTFSFNGMYAYQLNVSRFLSFRFGVQATYQSRFINFDKLTFADQIEDRRGFIYRTQEVNNTNSVNVFDASAGILGFAKQFYFGLAAHHLTQPNYSLLTNQTSRLPIRFTANAGAMIQIGNIIKETSISPNVIYVRQANFQQLNLGLYFRKGPFVAGLWYRNSDDLIALVGLQIEKFKIGYSYDINLETTKGIGNTTTAGSHEISLQYQFYCKPKTKKFKTINCPVF